jgi:hypothetical protein
MDNNREYRLRDIMTDKTTDKNIPVKYCPDCDIPLDTLLFLGIEPDGYVCSNCHVFFTDELKPLAIVIGG